MKGKIVGVGGIFFKTEDPLVTKEWYSKHLGIKTDKWGASFLSRQYSNSNKSAYLQWSPFKNDSDYFGDHNQQYMVNYRVQNIEDLLNNLKQEGVKICKSIEEYDYGKFAHIEDINGIRIELWEPVDEVFDNMYNDPDQLNTE